MKNYLIGKFSILYRYSCGIVIKLWYTLFFYKKSNVLNDTPREIPLIVSLTSYGRRVAATLPYTLVSLLKQQCKPDKIIVWLDASFWNMDNLPPILRKLGKAGIDFKFCEDIRSYTKLVPALVEYPDSIVITVDDDIYYRSTLIKDLFVSYQNNPFAIHAALLLLPKRDAYGDLMPYDQWEEAREKDHNAELFALGVGGCLYPPGSLYKDVTQKDLFMKLCPTADDIWFWAMARLESTKYVVVKTKKYFILDLLFELTHKGSALRHENVHEKANDVQLKRVLNYYNLK